MKKGTLSIGSLLFLLILSILVVGVVHAAPVDQAKAKRVAQNILFEKTGVPGKFTDPRIVFTKLDENKPLYHIMNFAKGGWAIVSADDVAHPVIAFSSTGSFSPDKPVSPEFQYWLDRVGHEISVAVFKKANPLQKTGSQWKKLSVDTVSFTPPAKISYETAVSPLVTTTWAQGQYYNQMCPDDAGGPDGHALVGCVAVAMSQMMKYHQYPATGVGSHSYTPTTYPSYGTLSADFGATTYNWASMPSFLADYDADVATIMYHAGVSVEMDYGPTGSAANTSADATNAFKTYFGYSDSVNYKEKASYTTEQWLTLLRTELDNSRPVLYRGSGAQGGHAFICDGYAAGDLSNNDYFHFNWGWNGGYDGYFYLDDLTPSGYDFTTDQGGIFNIKTISASLTYPYSQGFESGVPDEWNLTGYRAAISGADYRSGAASVLLGTPDETAYLNEGILSLYINVPAAGATLSFWVKRGFNPAASTYNQQYAALTSMYGDTVYNTFYDGDWNDSVWQEFTLDLSTWAGTTVKLLIKQINESGSYYQWTYVDDVSIELLAECGPGSEGQSCDDGNACTTADTCSSEVCVGGPAPNCNDSNVCTDDSCNPATGCVYDNNTASCNDGDACTTSDTCHAGTCGGSALDCNDSNVCTSDSCNSSTGCVYDYNTDPCNDSNACTTSDTCSAGSCVGGPAPNCNDSNVCTDDSCNPATGCVYDNNTDPCNDSNVCTTSDTCSGGSCIGGSALNCNDDNICTDDSCNPATGCVYDNNTDPCNDSNACTTSDTCSAGSCVGGPAPNCNDSNVCTDDSCNPATGCYYSYNTDPCNDSNACTTSDTCSAGSCIGGPSLDCTDSNACTDDSCDQVSGCLNVCSATAKSDLCCSNQVCKETSLCSFSWLLFLPAILDNTQL